MPNPAHRIVIGASLGSASDATVRAGLRLASAMAAEAHVVHALEGPGSGAGAPVERHDAGGAAGRRERLGEKLGDQARRLSSRHPERHRVERGEAGRVLADVAQRVGAELIVIGGTRARAARRGGSMAARIVRHSLLPVLVLRRHLLLPPRKVLAVVDSSALSTGTLERGLDILERSGATVTGAHTRETVEIELLYVAAPPGHQEPVELPPGGAGRPHRATESDASLAAGRSIGQGWRLRHRAACGALEREVLARIRAWRPDLVLVGIHGPAAGEGSSLKDVAGSVLHQADVNLLVIPAAAVGHPLEMATAGRSAEASCPQSSP